MCVHDAWRDTVEAIQVEGGRGELAEAKAIEVVVEIEAVGIITIEAEAIEIDTPYLSLTQGLVRLKHGVAR